ncbi:MULTISPECIES: YSIRK-type signal peptide-containing protein [Lactobacillus]|uniref:YSIRK-type signal peptide-containing protein n=1 Tax=Lactobacillus TaxID=1578 RepID=UPI0024907F93|nr:MULTISPECIES: YSIRK-type signal peptide-containing protein [Lactobacillus]
MKHKNDVIFNAKLNGKQKFSLRKLSIGLVAVALGTTFYLTNGQLVHADENTDQSSQTAVVENQSQDSSASTDSNSESSSSDDASTASTTSSTSDEESKSQTGSEQSNSSTQETAKTEDSANSSAESTSSDDDNSDLQTVSTGSIIDGNADASTLKESKSKNQQTVIVSSNAIDENGQVTSDPANTTMIAVQSEEASSTEAKELTSDTYQVNNVSVSATDKTTDASSH